MSINKKVTKLHFDILEWTVGYITPFCRKTQIVFNKTSTKERLFCIYVMLKLLVLFPYGKV